MSYTLRLPLAALLAALLLPPLARAQTAGNGPSLSNFCYLVADGASGQGGTAVTDRFSRVGKYTLNQMRIPAGGNQILYDNGSNTPSYGIEAAAFAPTRSPILYTVTKRVSQAGNASRNADQFGRLNLETGRFTPIGGPGFSGANSTYGQRQFIDIDGLAFDYTSGALYAVERVEATSGNGGAPNARDILFQINPETGNVVPNAFTQNGTQQDYVLLTAPNVNGATLNTADDIAINPLNGQLWGIANNDSGERGRSTIIRINKATGVFNPNSGDGEVIRRQNGTRVGDVEGLSFDYRGVAYATTGANATVAEDQSNFYRFVSIGGAQGTGPANGQVELLQNLSTRGGVNYGVDYEAVACLAPTQLGIAGGAGFRYLTSPQLVGTPAGSSFRVRDLAAQNLVQGVAGVYDGKYDNAAPNLTFFEGRGSGGYNPPANAQTALPNGIGYSWYLYDNARVPESRPLPFTLEAAGPVPNANVTRTLNSPQANSAEQSTVFIGNPFDVPFALDALQLPGGVTGGAGVSNVAYVYNYETGTFRSVVLDGSSGELLAPFEGFFICTAQANADNRNVQVGFPASGRRNTATTTLGAREGVQRAASARVLPAAARANTTAPVGVAAFTLTGHSASGEAVTHDDIARFVLASDAELGYDRWDALRPPGGSGTFATLSFAGARPDGTTASKALESRASDTEAFFTVPLNVNSGGLGDGATLTLAWPTLKNIPASWGLTLTDNETGHSVDLHHEADYTFSPAPAAAALEDHATRFTLTVDPGGSLPVEMDGLSARADGQGAALLTWRTLGEAGNEGFRVQRRTDGGVFETIDFVGTQAPNGMSTKPVDYRYRAEDLAPGTHAFRLQQVDRNGTLAQPTAAVEATLEMERYYLSAPYPNPTASGQATVEFGARAEGEHVTIALFDALGQRVRTLHDGPVPAGAGEPRSLTIGASELASGVYMIRLRGTGGTRTQSLTIVK